MAAVPETEGAPVELGAVRTGFETVTETLEVTLLPFPFVLTNAVRVRVCAPFDSFVVSRLSPYVPPVCDHARLPSTE
jgi:hypothetical protein